MEDAIGPDLIALLRTNFLPLHEKLLLNVKDTQDAHYENLAAKVLEFYGGMSSDIKWIKQHLGQSYQIQEQINSTLSENNYPRKVHPKQIGIQDDIQEDKESEKTLRDM